MFVIILIAVIAIILYLYFHQQKQKVTGPTPYQEALVALLEQNEDLAMKKLVEAVSIDSDLIDAYVRLGDLYRKKGDLAKAIQVHQSLTVRALLKKQVEKKVYYALVNDFLAINRPNKAISFLKEILKIDKKDQSAMDLMLRIYEDMEDYAGCINVYEESDFKLKQENRLAFYYASLANHKFKNMSENGAEAEKEVLNHFKKALRISNNSLTALYYLTSYYEQKEDLRKAKEYYLKITTHHPDHLFLIIPPLEKVFFDLGSFGEIISIYEKNFDKKPENFSVGFALANLYQKKNDIESAKYVYRRLTERFPKSILPKLHLLKLMTDDKAIKNEIAEIKKTVSEHQFKCRNCGNEIDKFSFICKKCRAIESFLPYL